MQIHPVLVITYSFPPDSAVGGRRVARFCKYLPAFGFRPIVLTVQPKYVEMIDDSFVLPAGLRVERTEIWPTPLDLYARWRSRTQFPALSAPSNSAKPVARDTAFTRTFKRQLFGLLRMPDAHWGWYGPAVGAAERLIREESIQAIFSTAPPWTDQMIARRLQKKFGLPWVADFRDAWTFDSWRLEWQEIPRWRDRLDRHWEASCTQLAHVVTTVTPEITEDFRRHYPAESPRKFVTITNGYDDPDVDVAPAKEVSTGRRLLVHTGELYGDRRIATFCRAVADLMHTGRLPRGSFKVLFVGSYQESILSEAREAAPELFDGNSIEFRAQVNWREARAIMLAADVLLVFLGKHRLALTAKFFDYLQTGKPILAIVEEGALSRMLTETRSGVSADPSDTFAIAEKVMEALALHQRSPREVASTAGQYHARNLTAQLAASLLPLIEESSLVSTGVAEQA